MFSAAAQTAHDIIVYATNGASSVNFASGESIGLGIAIIIASLICRSAAELMSSHGDDV